MPPGLNIQTKEDYVLGFIQGSIMGMFISFYRSTYAQNLPLDLQTEVAQIIFRRSREVRDAICNAG